MSRILKFAYLSVAASLLLTFVFSRAAPKDPPKTDKTDEPVYAKINKRVNFNGADDPKLTLGELLDHLATQYDIVIDVNERAFRSGTDDLKDVTKFPLIESAPIPPMKNARFEMVLRKHLDRLPNATGATFTVRRDHIEITTIKAQQDEFWPHAPTDPATGTTMEPVFPLVHANFDKKPLDEALKELAERSDVTIILDVKAAEKDKPIVTARLANTPLDTAVQLLAEMSDLRSVALGKTLFVTSAEKAKRIDEQLHPQVNPFAPNPLGGCFIGVLGQLGALGQVGAFGSLGVVGQFGVGGVDRPAPGNFRPRTTPPTGDGK